jgi:hypothetical protein
MYIHTAEVGQRGKINSFRLLVEIFRYALSHHGQNA